MVRALLVLFLLCSSAFGATLLPPGKQQFFKGNGAPNAGGSIYFYVPGTTTPKDTYQDSAGTILNTNPVQLDSGGFAIIYGSGAYRMVEKDASGTTIYDQLTADTSSTQVSWAGSSGGSANAITLTAIGFSAQSGQSISWKNSFTNTGAVTVTIGGVPYGLQKDTLSGPTQLTGGELTQNNISSALYDSTSGQFHLVDGNTVAPAATLISGATTDIGSAKSSNVTVSGSATITSFGSSAFVASPLYFITFTENATLTHNATSLILPGAANITTTNGGTAIAKYLGSGNWQVLAYLSNLGVGTEFVNAQTGITYSILATDQRKLVSFSNTAAIAVTVPQATGAFGSGFWFDAQNVGNGAVTFTPITSTINGAASLLLPSGYGLRIVSDGVNWQIMGFSPLKGRVLLNTLSPSAVAFIEDTTSISSSFSTYDIEYERVIPANVGPSFEIQLYTGATLQTATYVNTAALTTGILLGTSVSNTGRGISGMTTVFRPLDASVNKIWNTVIINDTTGGLVSAVFGGYWNGGTAAVTGLRFLFSAGNITSGSIRIYGRN